MYNKKTRVEIAPSAPLLLAAFIFAASGKCLAAVLTAALFHELGHAAALRLCGGKTERIRVSAFGVRMEIQNAARLSYGQEALCILAGPLTNITLSWVLSLAGERIEAAYLFAGAQLVLGVFNLLPVAALDGGRLLWIGAAWRQDPFFADRLCRWVSLAVLAAGLTLGLLLWLRTRSGFLLLGMVGILCCTVRDLGLVNSGKTR